MPASPGEYRLLDPNGVATSEGSCQFSFDRETAILTPVSGVPVAFDLGDVERATSGEQSIELAFHSGRKLELRGCGAIAEALLAAWRDRTVEGLLLEDPAEIARHTATVNGVSAEIRLYARNLVVLPSDGVPVQWRLTEIDAVSFDSASYTVMLVSGADHLAISQRGMQADQFLGQLRAARDRLRTSAADALRKFFPFLNPGQLQRLLTRLPEGRNADFADLAGIHPHLPDALIDRAIDEPLRPYFDGLRSLSAGVPVAGFQLPHSHEDASVPAAGSESPWFWFFFRIPGRNIVAWQAAFGNARATYFFRADPPVEAAIACLTRGLALVNFRREPLELPDEALDQVPGLHRYAIARRKLPELKCLRAALIGRAVHSTLEAWTAQVHAITA